MDYLEQRDLLLEYDAQNILDVATFTASGDSRENVSRVPQMFCSSYDVHIFFSIRDSRISKGFLRVLGPTGIGAG